MSASKPASAEGLSHIRELDGIRGIAALMVFFHHAAYANLQEKHWAGPMGWLVGVCKYGNTGVDLFFVLSGFLITSILLRTRKSRRYYQDFYWKRALRILPLYLVCALVALAATRNVGAFVLSTLFLANFASVLHVTGVGPFWTLAIEEQFYVIWPTVVRRRSQEQVMKWALCVGFGAVLLRIVAACFGHFNYFFSFLHCDGLAFGAVLACTYRNLQNGHGDRKRSVLTLYALALLGVIAFPISAWIVRAKITYPSAFEAAVLQTGVVLVTGALIGLTIYYSGARVLGLLRSRVLMFFGLISYALYMIHDGALDVYDHFFGPILAGQDQRLLTRLMVVLAITIVLCVISRYVIELPAMSLRKRVLSHPSPTAETEYPPLPLANQ